jgi:hypothetical protein
MTTPKDERFYIVHVPSVGRFSEPFADKDEARKEARRVACDEGRVAYVLCAVCAVEPPSDKPTVVYLRARADDVDATDFGF